MFNALAIEFAGRNEELFEGIVMLIAAAVLTYNLKDFQVLTVIHGTAKTIPLSSVLNHVYIELRQCGSTDTK